MKLLILGGNGMAGHALVKYFKSRPGYQVMYTSRDGNDQQAICLDASNLEAVDTLLELVRPQVVINAVGILNQRAESDRKLALLINGMLPHRLSRKLDNLGGRRKLIHISSDCVFSGAQGNYTERNVPDGTSEYAKTKAIGEVKTSPHLTVRTSIIGPEIRDERIGLFDWFMRQSGDVHGYTEVFWNGVTTLQLAKSIEELLVNNVSGLYHLVAPEKVSKFQLLSSIATVFDKGDVNLIPYEGIQIDRTLQCTRTDYVCQVPPYSQMLTELRDWMKER